MGRGAPDFSLISSKGNSEPSFPKLSPLQFSGISQCPGTHINGMFAFSAASFEKLKH